LSRLNTIETGTIWHVLVRNWILEGILKLWTRATGIIFAAAAVTAIAVPQAGAGTVQRTAAESHVPDAVAAATNWHDRCDDRDGGRHHRHLGGDGLLAGLLEGLLGLGDDRWDDNCRGDDRDRWGDDNWRDDRDHDNCRDEGRHHRHHRCWDDDLREL
jgi:hypothetical protein